MPDLFSSRREKHLWLWTVVVVVAIYSTLALTSTLARAVGSDLLGAVLFTLGMVLVAGSVLLQALRARPGGVEIGVALGVVAAYLMVFVRMASPVERSHLIEYGVVALFVHEALLERARHEPRSVVRRHGRAVRRPALVAILVTAIIGAVDEGIQAVIPTRVYDPVDILFNVLAAVMAVVASVVLRWARRRRSPAG